MPSTSIVIYIVYDLGRIPAHKSLHSISSYNRSGKGVSSSSRVGEVVQMLEGSSGHTFVRRGEFSAHLGWNKCGSSRREVKHKRSSVYNSVRK